ncbi:MAG: PIN domain-containing protein [Opitutaceae bacterium]
MPAYGIDTSLLVRLLTGQPPADYQTTVNCLTALRTSQPEHITAANIVIAEAYAVLQHHYGLAKPAARAALLSVLTSGLIEPAAGDAVLEALKTAKEPGLTDRLIALDYARLGAITLTLDRKMASLPDCQKL